MDLNIKAENLKEAYVAMEERGCLWHRSSFHKFQMAMLVANNVTKFQEYTERAEGYLLQKHNTKVKLKDKNVNNKTKYVRGDVE